MALLTTKIDMNGIPEALRELVQNDLPFITCVFLTKQALSGQKAARAGERSVFNLRNDWTTNRTLVKVATKDNLVSQVYTDTANRKSGAPDYILKQVDGGDRSPEAGHQHLAIPTKYLRKLAPGIIPAALRPTKLLPPNAKFGQEYAGKFGRVGKAAAPYPRTKRQHEALSPGSFVAFLQRSKSGTLCIFVRHGGIGYHGAAHDAEPFYTLVTHAQIKARFPMEKIVQEAIDRDAEVNFTKAAAEVLSNAKYRGTGVRFRF